MRSCEACVACAEHLIVHRGGVRILAVHRKLLPKGVSKQSEQQGTYTCAEQLGGATHVVTENLCRDLACRITRRWVRDKRVLG